MDCVVTVSARCIESALDDFCRIIRDCDRRLAVIMRLGRKSLALISRRGGWLLLGDHCFLLGRPFGEDGVFRWIIQVVVGSMVAAAIALKRGSRLSCGTCVLV